MVGSAYEKLIMFKKKYKHCVTWFRLKKHCQILDRHLNPDEEIKFIFAGQLDDNALSFFNTGVVAVTNERLVIAQNRLIVGYKFQSVTPDLYNDLSVDSGFLWGTINIDTVKEQIHVSDLDKKSLAEIETQITMFMQNAKKKYKEREDNLK